MPQATMEGWDSPLIFTKHTPVPFNSRPKDEAGFGSLLPNEEGVQNAFATFYTPKQNTLGMLNPMVDFRPLQTDQDEKAGATLGDLLGLVYYLYRSKDMLLNPKKEDPYAPSTKKIRKACEVMTGLGPLPLGSALGALRDKGSHLMDFVRTDTETYLQLIMHFGKPPYTGFLYGTLLAFVNMLIKITRKSLTPSSTADSLLEIEKLINLVLKESLEKKTKINPPFEIPQDLSIYEKDQQLYPQTVAEYLKKKGYLSDGTTFGAYWETEENNKVWLYATFNPIKRGEPVTITYFEDEAKKKPFATVVLSNVKYVMGEAETKFEWKDYVLEEIPLELTITFIFQEEVEELNAKRKGDSNIFEIRSKGYEVDLEVENIKNFWHSRVIPQYNKIPGDRKIKDIKIQAKKCQMTLTQGKEIVVQCHGVRDKFKSVYSQTLGKDLVKVFRYPTKIGGKDVVLFTYHTKHTTIHPQGKHTDLKISQIYVRSKDKKVEPAKLYALYHYFRRKLESQKYTAWGVSKKI